MKLKGIFLSCVTALTAAATAAAASAASNGLVTETVSQKMLASASGVNVTYRSQADIRDYVSANPFSTSEAISFSKQPDLTTPYENSGALNSSSLQNGLNAVNVMRYIAGLPEVTLNSEYNALCQDGAYISALNNTISHSPDKPSDVSDSIYTSGKSACGSSNLAMGYSNLAAAVSGYMNDSDSSNIDRLGHRRWILNPAMKQTGMGQVDRYSALYAFDNAFGEASQNGVCWPAQNMPEEYFGSFQAWSWSSGESIVDPTAVKVTLKRTSDGKTWSFSHNSADGYFNVENSNYGAAGCVIFRPDDITIKAGDSYTVNIAGTGKTVNYTVNFFSLNPSGSSDNTVTPAAVTGLKASKSTANSITLSWNKNSTADSYEVDMYKNGKWEYVAKVTDNSYTVSGLSANTSYDFKVFSFKEGKYSNSAQLTAKTAAAPQSSDSAASNSSSAASNSSSVASSSSNAASSSSSVTSSSSSAVSSSSSAQTTSGTSADESSQAAADNNSSFPIVPVAVGGGVVAAGGIGALVAHLIKIRKGR